MQTMQINNQRMLSVPMALADLMHVFKAASLYTSVCH